MKKIKRQDRLNMIFAECSQHGEITKRALELYVEGNISYEKYMNAAKRGIEYYDKRKE